MEQKVCIITGANSVIGIGAATAKLLGKAGVKAVYLCDVVGDNLQMTAENLKREYPVTDFIAYKPFDAASEEAVRRVVADAIKKYGRLDFFFANAGIIGPVSAFTDIGDKEFMNVLRVNTLSVFLAIKYAATAMKEKGIGGSIVATASVAGTKSGAGTTPYSASKAAVINLVQTTAWQLAGTGIRVNAICPGLIETGMTKLTYDAARQRGTVSKIGQLNPTRRGGRPEEVAEVVTFLASDNASYVNGQFWLVDGGLSASLPVVPGKMH
ncbi:hypothetical protein CANCADRAFT_44579 [Tortispora caseinolytica NRRL Y-17796]|uniref:Uncharacterized protein n=1 Tax=Tortispora caseinolytica NRRL Y-17796 TaxID=767744 RepID=A0A1E4TGV9_9ASCO|nr:hypothetical protein CANCADRAFT_44579 [Tortispora caseinolytica NRRL Y-17796]